MISTLREISNNVKQLGTTLNDFLKINEDGLSNQLNSCKKLYDLSREYQSEVWDDCLDELLLDDFDDEQVWQQIDLVNKHWIQNLNKYVKNVSNTQPVENKSEDVESVEMEEQPDEDDIEEEREEEIAEDSDIDSEDENLKRILKKIEHNDKLLKNKEKGDDALFNNDDDDDDYDIDTKEEKKAKKVKFSEDVMFKDSDNESEDDNEIPIKKEDNNYALNMLKQNLKSTEKRPKIANVRESLNDRFFKLNQMEEFLDIQDAKEQRKIDGEEEEDDGEESDENIDVFQDFTDDEDGDEDENQKSGSLKFEDFFDQPEDGKMETNEDLIKDDEEEEEEDESIGRGAEEVKSKFEKTQELLKKKIEHLEDDLVAEKSWQMRGEVEGVVRPVNSLLHEPLQHETNVKEAPIITEEVTKSIEDKIIQRLKDKIWDGPQRKIRVNQSAFDLEMKKRKKVIIDEEKHKLSLAEEYEKEYFEKNKKEEAKLPEAIQQIHKSMETLFRKLDALSNYHFTPKPPVVESEIITYLPSINMEEVAPVVHSEMPALAPHEIMGKDKRGLVGDSEKTDTDKKRMRRLKKKQQHLKRLKQEDIGRIKKIKTDERNAKFKSKTDSFLDVKKKPLKEKKHKGKKY